ncbi:MAG: PPC domain-containing DNA-binding protein [Cyanobacteriota bacterium]|jgi:predicted DNA-binding protein with PD1-like motif
MKVIMLRLPPGAALRRALEAWMGEQQEEAGCVISTVGSLSVAHLHFTMADSSGRVLGGHLCAGSLVRTTAELVIARRVSSRSGGRCWLA